jgi:signal transduction histidine kinase
VPPTDGVPDLPQLTTRSVSGQVLERLRATDQRREEQLRAVLDNIGDGVVVADADGRITEFNPAARRILGRGPTEASPEEWPPQFGLFRPDGVTPFPADEVPLTRAIRGEATNQVEMVIRQPSLEAPIFVSVTGRPIKGADGVVTGGVVILHDITERKRAEQELRNSNRELEEFAYVASHDLQEPLRKVQAFASCLRDSQAAVLDAEGRDYLDRLQSAGARMAALVSDLLEISSISSKKRQFVPVNLNEVVAEVVLDLETRLTETAGRVEVLDLPTVVSDPLQMRRLLQNLIANALKFHRKGQAPVVRISAELSEGTCRLSVADNGIGFDEKYLETVFAMFQRLHGRGEFEGTGMGLAICRRIVERHGGTITARSTLGQGATFIVTMPILERTR